ncbi:MAG: DNA-binding response regulator [Deltaproteobacteria bacterium]|nr:DNA-binding response regulator [Deltaproteobacteria bacterium]
MRILLVEDDEESIEYIARGLREEGHSVDCVHNGRDGLLYATMEEYDVLVIDRMLPELDGLSLIKTLRAANCKVPALFLTAMGDIDARVEGLQAGGDDYMVKPFAFVELSARIGALARRPNLKQETTTLCVADLQMDLLSRTVTRGGERIELQAKEFKLLEVLLKHQPRVLTRTMLLDRVWDIHFSPKTSVVETHISRLRSKIDKPFDVQLIHTVRGVGYSIHESI